MARKQAETEDQPDDLSAPADELRVAYYFGPEEIWFDGKLWRRGHPQVVSLAEWDGMRQRGVFYAFEFGIVE